MPISILNTTAVAMAATTSGNAQTFIRDLLKTFNSDSVPLLMDLSLLPPRVIEEVRQAVKDIPLASAAPLATVNEAQQEQSVTANTDDDVHEANSSSQKKVSGSGRKRRKKGARGGGGAGDGGSGKTAGSQDSQPISVASEQAMMSPTSPTGSSPSQNGGSPPNVPLDLVIEFTADVVFSALVQPLSDDCEANLSAIQGSHRASSDNVTRVKTAAIERRYTHPHVLAKIVWLRELV
jgi:hypothetical protein